MPPPFTVDDDTCLVEIQAKLPSYKDRFSFEQVRDLVQVILDDCQDDGGVGGMASVGRQGLWLVIVRGLTATPSPGGSNGTAFIQSEPLSNGTLLSAVTA